MEGEKSGKMVDNPTINQPPFSSTTLSV